MLAYKMKCGLVVRGQKPTSGSRIVKEGNTAGITADTDALGRAAATLGVYIAGVKSNIRQLASSLNDDIGECGGHTRALAKLITNQMMGLYPANPINITLTHNDAQVTLRFKGANKKSIPA